MTATERIRAMLDERGVEHYDGTERTLWGYEQTGEDTGIYRFAASEISGGFLQFDMFRITPEQAITATLGTGTCHDEGDPSDFCCSECGMRMFTNTSDTYTMIASDGRTIIKHPN
jgi:hypothetical protein